MPDIQIDQDTLLTVIEQLNIRAPVYSAIELEDGSIQIHTRYGSATWTPPKAPDRTDTAPQPAPGHAETDDLTTAPGIGDATADKLHAEGIETVQDLIDAIDQVDGILDMIPSRYRSKALQWLYQQQGDKQK